MGLDAGAIAGHPALHGFIRSQSSALVLAYEANPRLSSVFATQQRWLMGHIGLALFFRRQAGRGLSSARFFDMMQKHGVASRNTADAFLKEMLRYAFIAYSPDGPDRRTRLMHPTTVTLEAIAGWVMVHLATLDGLDNGNRAQNFLATENALDIIQPLISDGLVTSAEVREPPKTFSLFTWLNNGGVIMDRLIAGMADAHPGEERIQTSINSISEMGAWIQLSRTHLARKLKEAEAIGSLGWMGKRGNSRMWVSKGFRQEYIMAQAVKLAIIDAAYDACLMRR